MTVIVNFLRKGRTVHTRDFEIKDVDLFIIRLNSQFDEYELMCNEEDITDTESAHYDKCENSYWYTYTGRMGYVKTIYGARWWYEYEDEDGNTRFF